MSLTQTSPSRYQIDIINFALNGKGDIFVDAVAGSGKTTTLEMIARELSRAGSKALFLAFNRHTADELKNKLEPLGHDVSTIHSVGFLCLREALKKTIVIDKNKYQEIIRKLVNDASKSTYIRKEDFYPICSTVYEVFKFCRSSLIDPSNEKGIDKIVSHYDVDITTKSSLEIAKAILPRVNELGKRIAQQTGTMSYCDMLWLPHVLKLTPQQYDYVLVDEAQDLSSLQLDLVLKCRNYSGKTIFVGDEHQAIYGFAGSDTQSVAEIIRRTNAKRFPLSVCYRCPKSHIDLAKKIVSQIESSPHAEEGSIEFINRDDLVKYVRAKDLIICRTTSPLVSAAFEIVQKGIPAKIKGQDIGRSLVSILKKIQRNVESNERRFNIDNFLQESRIYESKTLSSILDAGEDYHSKQRKITDQFASLNAIYCFAKPKNIESFTEAIKDMFSDTSTAVTLSTVHRAKGLEEDRVFVLESDNMPHPLARTQWEREQEMNIKYVALTRAKKSLFLVNR